MIKHVNETLMITAHRLKLLRKTLGFSQSEIALWLGCATSSIPNYENGSSDFPFRYVLKLMRHGIPLAFFIDPDYQFAFVDIAQIERNITEKIRKTKLKKLTTINN